MVKTGVKPGCKSWARYSARDVKVIRALAGKVPTKQIAAVLGRTQDGVRSWASAHGVSLEYRFDGQELADTARRLKSEGLSREQAAERMGISKSWLTNGLGHRGLTWRGL